MKRLLTLLIDHPSAWAFASPVNAAEVSCRFLLLHCFVWLTTVNQVTDYYDVIKQPMGPS
jgi:histone acetyltransferase